MEAFYLRGAAAIAALYFAFVVTVTKGGLPVDLLRTTLLPALLAYGLGLALVLGLLWAWAMKSEGSRSRTNGRTDARKRLIDAKADRAGHHIPDGALLCLMRPHWSLPCGWQGTLANR